MCNSIIPNIPNEILASIIGAIWTLLSVALGLFIWFHYWKKQTRTEKEYESVIVFLESLTRYYNALKQVRNSYIPISEFWPYIDNEENWHYKWISYAYQKRWDKLVEAEANMDDKKVVLELLLDSKIEENLGKLITLRQKLYTNLEMLLENKRNGGEMRHDSNIIYWFFNDEDIFDKESKKEIEEIRLKLKTYLLK